ncbi:uncharacterized protein PV09_09576 [Verruconis gallopava]|uniref:Nuclear protein DGCR14 n=1 Tax=Verruconis gallopava TaxID=253628 RepID=A0A0D2AI84_9PEZI|nr:uncharacterized protein PV09_09576 [Verruconis gallopava]KIV98628.1 hypothetical protein PV09_09576 [Verruconis gallopava]
MVRCCYSKALTKRSAEDSLMLPPPPTKKIKRPSKVLDEDQYTSALSHIIARDFFPGLEETASTQEYLDALQSEDKEWIARAGKRLTQIMTPGPNGRQARGKIGTRTTPYTGLSSETPQGWVGDTPWTVGRTEVHDQSRPKPPNINMNMSLSAFQAKYTSEDNESFNALLDKGNEQNRQKNAWLWNGNQIPGGARVLEQAKQQKSLEALNSPSASNDIILADRACDKRPAMPEYRKAEPKNSLMFIPDSIEDYQQTSIQEAEAKSLAPPKAINYAGTRMPDESNPVSSVPPSPSMSAVDAAVTGRPHFSASEAGYSGAETPRVAGYKFVDAEVQPHEITYMERRSRGESKEQPDPDNVLRLLGSPDATPNPFKLPETSNRERLHLKLVDRVNRNRRTSSDRLGALMGGQTPGRTPTPKFMSASGIKRAPGNLTPAAQNLLRKIGTSAHATSAWDAKSKGKEDSKLAGVTPRISR